MNTVRVLLSLAANLDWPLKQFDVKNAFLHEDLKEELYMDIPPGYGLSNNSGKSPRAWFGQFTEAMKKYGYHEDNSYHILFIKHWDGKITMLIIYVNDMVVTGDDVVEMGKL
ncbi:unnamed protein product [Prunus armeniaca]